MLLRAVVALLVSGVLVACLPVPGGPADPVVVRTTTTSADLRLPVGLAAPRAGGGLRVLVLEVVTP